MQLLISRGLIPHSLLHGKLMTNEVSLGLVSAVLLRGVSLVGVGNGKWVTRSNGLDSPVYLLYQPC